ncbi:MAG: Calx-beta domain-containing protein, partial [Limisphaerales bacterium]
AGLNTSDPVFVLTPSDAGFLDRDGDGIREFEVNSTQPLTHPLKMLFPPPAFETPGAVGKQWVQVEVRYVDGITTWLINGYVIAEHGVAGAFGQTTGKIMLGYMDVFNSIANPRADNYVIYDNVRVVSLNGQPATPVVTIAASQPNASEPATHGAFTVTRTGATTSSLAVNYRVSGTASNGVDYATLSGTVTIPAGQSSANIPVTVIDDSVAESVETVIVTLLGGTNYEVRDQYTATVEIADDGDTTPFVNLITSQPFAYEPNPVNPGRLTVALPGTTASPVTVNYSLSGTATNGVHYNTLTGSITVPAGQSNAVINIVPINDSVVNSNRTATVTLSAGAGYILGTNVTGTVTIRDDDHIGTGTVLYSETFDSNNTANWTVNKSTGANANDAGNIADFYFDYSTVGIPPAPGSGSTTRGLKLQANLTGGIFSGLSVSPTGQNFSGDYRFRAHMWLNFHGPLDVGGAGTTQVTGLGVGTAGTTAQWANSVQDSVFFGVTCDGGSAIDYRAYSSAAATGYAPASGVFAGGTASNVRDNVHPYYDIFGRQPAPAAQLASYPQQTNVTAVGTPGFAWREVVVEKQGNNITWFMDGLRIATVDASTVTLGGGNILLNHFDINAGSSADPLAPTLHFGLFDNVRVETISTAPPQAPSITGIQKVGSNIEISFTGATTDAPASFKLQRSATVNGTYADDNAANITSQGSGSFKATIPVNGSMQFYRIKR